MSARRQWNAHAERTYLHAGEADERRDDQRERPQLLGDAVALVGERRLAAAKGAAAHLVRTGARAAALAQKVVKGLVERVEIRLDVRHEPRVAHHHGRAAPRDGGRLWGSAEKLGKHCDTRAATVQPVHAPPHL